MPGDLLWTREDGKKFHKGDIIELCYDDEFAIWNDLRGEKHGLLVDMIDYIGLGDHKDVMAYVLIGDKFMHFEWEDIEVVHEEG